MPKNLVIVESPSKSKTIEKYLGSDYKVLSSVGHIRNLAKTGPGRLGVDIENGFVPKFSKIRDKIKIINQLKKEAKNADFVYLATDPDREGEAISWHLAEVLELDFDDYNRVVFNEITKNAVLSSFESPRKIDMGLVNSQQTRRILDRIIGFKLSRLLKSKINSQSAGRVQSVALKLIVDREREREAFVADEYWKVEVDFGIFKSELTKIDGKKVELKTKEETDSFLNNLSDTFVLEKILKKDKSKSSRPPYRTSTLQQDASNKLGFGSSKTMSVAQSLYEGVDLGSETVGLITYMRTDSTRLSNEFVNSCFNYIESNYGKEYLGQIKKAKSGKNDQDAHEAIRPTDITRTPKSVKKFLKADQYKLYSMIYARALASLMANASFDSTTFQIVNNNGLFTSTGQIIKFDGYLKVYSDYETNKDEALPNLEEGKELSAESINPTQHFTQPPARYSEAKLIKEMEELGIGRPSTYALTMATLKKRNYVKIDAKKFIPTEQGVLTSDSLAQYFSDIINVEYTANMENDLDKIAVYDIKSLDVLTNFYEKFEPMVQKADESMEKVKPQETGEMCPECGSPLVIRKGRYGDFIACSGFPKCRYIKQEEKELETICDCPECDGKIIEKKTRRGKLFYGCSNYPECKVATWNKPTSERCPKCNQLLVDKNGKVVCSSCEYNEEENK